MKFDFQHTFQLGQFDPALLNQDGAILIVGRVALRASFLAFEFRKARILVIEKIFVGTFQMELGICQRQTVHLTKPGIVLLVLGRCILEAFSCRFVLGDLV